MADSNIIARIEARLAEPETELQAEPTRWGGRSIPRQTDLDALTPVRIKQLLKLAETGDIVAQAELFELMEERDGELGAHLQTRKSAVARAARRIIPNPDVPDNRANDAERAADYCRDIVRSIPGVRQAIFDLLDAVGKGFAVQEIKWRRSKSEWTPVSLIYRPQRWFTLAEDGVTLQVVQVLGATAAPINPLNFIVHQVRSQSGFLWRTALMRRCVRAFIVRHYSWKDWMAFAEVYGMPARVGKLREGVAWDSDEARQFYAAVRALGQDFAAVIEDGNEIELLEIGNRGLSPYEAILDRAGRELTLAILGQTLTSGGEQGGSYALGQVHNQVRTDLSEEDADTLGETLSEQFLGPIVRLNLGDLPIPRWDIAIERPRDLSALATTVKTLVEIKLPVGTSWAYEQFGIPEPAPDESLLEAPAPGGMPFGNAVAQPVHGPCMRPATAPHGAAFLNAARAQGEPPAELWTALNQNPTGPAYGPVPENALAWLRERRVVDPKVWDALSPAGRQRAWWVTGLDQANTSRLAAALMDIIQRGGSENDFLNRIEALGIGAPGSEEAGPGQIQAWQARLVHRNNRFSAYNAARWMDMQRDAVLRPYAQWVCGSTPCPICEPLRDIVAPLDGATFSRYAPQLHHGCECTLVSVSALDMEREGLEIRDDAHPLGAPEDWVYDRNDAYYLESAGGAPATDAGRADLVLLSTQPLPGDV